MDGLMRSGSSYAGLVGLAVSLSPAPVVINQPESVPAFKWAELADYQPTNVSTRILSGEKRLVGDPVVDYYQPRTELGRKLIALRRAYILGGGKLMSQDEILDAVRHNRGEWDVDP